MPKIVVNAFLTLDGVMQAPGGPEEDREGGFAHGGWQAPYSDDVMGRLVTEGITDADGFLLGRKTYDIFANYWPKVTDPNHPIATALNSRPKYVVSRSLDRVTWNNSSLIKRGHSGRAGALPFSTSHLPAKKHPARRSAATTGCTASCRRLLPGK